jgi:MraZ protein
MFSGTHKLTIDDKGRLAIPSRVRTQLGDEFGKQIAITLGPECVEIYPSQVFRRIAEAILKIRDRAKRVQMQRLFVGNAVETEFDTQGRVNLPPLLRQAKGLGSDVVLVGQIDHFELWPEAAWAASNLEGQASYAEAFAALEI